MEIIGWIFVAIMAMVLVVALALGVASLPDARRYLKIRRM